MDYEKILFLPKTEISHFSSESYEEQSTSSQIFLNSVDTYASYADNFDLSLLPNESEFSSRPAAASYTSPCSTSLDFVSSATIYHERRSNLSTPPHAPTCHQIKIEQTWSEPNDSMPSVEQQSSSIVYDQLQQKQQYNCPPPQVYPSPQSSPAQNDSSSHLNLLCTNISSCGDNKTSSFPLSPCPSIENINVNQKFPIKQEFHILPPSPPESNCEALSPHSFTEIKSEPLDADVEKLIDISSFLENSLKELDEIKKSEFGITGPQQQQQQHQDHQLLREYLEDTTFQRKHNLKPLALESLIGGLGVRGDIEPVISLALEHAKRDAEKTCAKLQISPDPKKWSPTQVHAWLRSTIEQFQLPPIIDLELQFSEDGTTLALLTEEEFVRKAPEVGATIHAQLEIWKLAYSDNFNSKSEIDEEISSINGERNEKWNVNGLELEYMEVNETDDEHNESLEIEECQNTVQPEMGTAKLSNIVSANKTATAGRVSGSSHIHLWQFLKELLASPQVNGTAIRWIDRSKGVFKIEDSVRVAKLWGRRKNRPAMNYDKLSRSIRQYYKKGIMKKTERSQRLVYQFCHPYSL